jgi:NRAMP (natural resistance-associated macrophage protein)-like metal ion transporter
MGHSLEQSDGDLSADHVCQAGIATGKNLTMMCKEAFSKRANWFFYLVATIAAMATTMAEFLGGVLGFYLLFGIPLTYSVILTAAVTFAIVYLQRYGQRIVEIVIAALVAVICVAYTIELFLAKPTGRRLPFTPWSLPAQRPCAPDSVGMLGQR